VDAGVIDPAIYVAGAGTYFIARIPTFPGCNASGKTRDEAIANLKRAFKEYLGMLAARGVSTDHWESMDVDAMPIRETPSDSVFPGEDQPLEEHELRDFLHQYEASRATVIALLTRLTSEQVETAPDEKTWSVRQVLEHMLQTDITLLSRLEKWPDDPFNAFQAAHRLVFQRFSVMEPEDSVDHTIGPNRFTTRKVMRRLLEHEFEHYGHLKEIIAALEGAAKT
jgi:predicted RNase H-like HicB family nuclease